MSQAMLFDESRCIECQACSVNCKNSYGPGQPVFRTWVTLKESGSFPQVTQGLMKSACMHCSDAPCVEVCPTGAMHKTPEGLTDVNKTVCIGCNYCAANCPYEAINFIRAENTVDKCHFCRQLLARGMDPVCVNTCPAGALRFGPRDEMLQAGRDAVSALTERGYPDAHLYGETQLGGQRNLYVLKHEPIVYGLPVDPQVPVTLSVVRLLTNPVGGVAAAAAAIILAADFVRNRRIKVGSADNG